MWMRNTNTKKLVQLAFKKTASSFLLAFSLMPALTHAEVGNASTSLGKLAPTQPGPANPTPEQLHQDLRKLLATIEKALNAMDIDTVIANVTGDVVYTTMNGDVAHGRDGIRKYFEGMMKGPKPRVTSLRTHFEVDELSHLYGNNVAIAFGSAQDHYALAGGDTLDVNARWSATMIRIDGRWLIANFHYSTNIFDNPVLDEQRKFLLISTTGAGAVLILLSFVIGRAKGKSLGK